MIDDIGINKYFVCETLECYLSQVGHYYIGTKSNKKKILDFFHSLPFFFFNKKTQNILYKVIQKNNVSAYIDSNETMKKLCFHIYQDFCLVLNFNHKDYENFYDSIHFKMTRDNYYMKNVKQKHIHTFIFGFFLLAILCVYYLLSKRLYH